MALTDIPNPIPLVIPATVEKIYDKQFCTRLEIIAAPGTPWVAKITGNPYDGEVISRMETTSIRLQDLKALAGLDQELGQAMGLVLAVIGKYLFKCKIGAVHIVTAENVEEVLR